MTMGHEIAGISERDKIGLFKDCLNRGLDLRVRVTGKSMSPFLRGGEVLTIKRVPARSLREGDLILFLSGDGSPVLHRVITSGNIGDNSRTFHTKGDALYGFDEPVHEEAVLGKVVRVEIEHAGAGSHKSITMDSFFWKTRNCLIAKATLIRIKLRTAFYRISRKLKIQAGH